MPARECRYPSQQRTRPARGDTAMSLILPLILRVAMPWRSAYSEIPYAACSQHRPQAHTEAKTAEAASPPRPPSSEEESRTTRLSELACRVRYERRAIGRARRARRVRRVRECARAVQQAARQRGADAPGARYACCAGCYMPSTALPHGTFCIYTWRRERCCLLLSAAYALPSHEPDASPHALPLRAEMRRRYRRYRDKIESRLPYR